MRGLKIQRMRFLVLPAIQNKVLINLKECDVKGNNPGKYKN
jgi:hypothetical protein